MRPKTPLAVENGVGKLAACTAPNASTGKRAWRPPTPIFVPVGPQGSAGTSIFRRQLQPARRGPLHAPPVVHGPNARGQHVEAPHQLALQEPTGEEPEPPMLAQSLRHVLTWGLLTSAYISGVQSAKSLSADSLTGPRVIRVRCAAKCPYPIANCRARLSAAIMLDGSAHPLPAMS